MSVPENLFLNIFNSAGIGGSGHIKIILTENVTNDIVGGEI